MPLFALLKWEVIFRALTAAISPFTIPHTHSWETRSDDECEFVLNVRDLHLPGAGTINLHTSLEVRAEGPLQVALYRVPPNIHPNV